MDKALARQIISHFPKGWKFRDDDSQHCCYAVHSSGMELYLGNGAWNEKNKMSFSPSYPKDHNGHRVGVRDEDMVGTAKVSTDRDPASIARDITRRVIEPYTALYPKLIARVEEKREAADEHLRRVTKIQKLINTYDPNAKLVGDRSDEKQIRFGMGECKLFSRWDMNLEISDDSLVLRIFETIADYHRELYTKLIAGTCTVNGVEFDTIDEALERWLSSMDDVVVLQCGENQLERYDCDPRITERLGKEYGYSGILYNAIEHHEWRWGVDPQTVANEFRLRFRIQKDNPSRTSEFVDDEEFRLSWK